MGCASYLLLSAYHLKKNERGVWKSLIKHVKFSNSRIDYIEDDSGGVQCVIIFNLRVFKVGNDYGKIKWDNDMTSMIKQAHVTFINECINLS